MKLYHEVKPDSVGAILQKGLIRTSRGQKGDDKYIIQTDAILDQHRSSALKEAGVSRDDNLYCFYAHNGSITDIRDGAVVPLKKYAATNDYSVLEIDVPVKGCYVSDLDTYDALKDAVTHHQQNKLEQLAKSYWDKLTPLEQYQEGTFRRPEVMITFDIDPGHLRLLS